MMQTMACVFYIRERAFGTGVWIVKMKKKLQKRNPIIQKVGCSFFFAKKMELEKVKKAQERQMFFV